MVIAKWVLILFLVTTEKAPIYFHDEEACAKAGIAIVDYHRARLPKSYKAQVSFLCVASGS